MAFQPGSSSMVCVTVPARTAAEARRASAKTVVVVKIRISFSCSMAPSICRIDRQRRRFVLRMGCLRKHGRRFNRFKNGFVYFKRVALLNVCKQLSLKLHRPRTRQAMADAIGHLLQDRKSTRL